MPMTRAEAQPYVLVKHTRTGSLYQIKELALGKINEHWEPVVIYQSMLEPKTFVRETDAFCENFEVNNG